MRICFLYGGGVYATDGGIGFLRNLCSHLRMLGHNCFAILGGNEELLLEEAADQEVHVVGDWSIGLGLAQRHNRRRLKVALTDLKPDLVHIIHPPAYYGVNGHIHSLPILWRDFPTVVTFWGFNMGRGSNWRAVTVVLILLWGAQAVATHDFGNIQKLRRLCGGLRTIHFLPVGSNILPSDSVFAASRTDTCLKHGLDPAMQYIAYFGGFDPGRGLGDLFRAVGILRDRGYDHLRLLMIGWQRHLSNPTFRPVQQAMAREGVEKVVIMTPYAGDDEVASLMRAANLMVFPFHRNSLGRSSLMAALNVGAAVIVASPPGGLGPLQGAVQEVPPGNPAALAEKIQILLANPPLAEDLAAAGHRAWEEHFSWPVIAQKHLTVYQRALAGKIS